MERKHRKREKKRPLCLHRATAKKSRLMWNLRLCGATALLVLPLLYVAHTAEAGKPVLRAFEGCAIEMMTISTRGYRYRFLRHHSVGVSYAKKYNGLHFRVRGWLYPGDAFRPKPKTIRVLVP